MLFGLLTSIRRSSPALALTGLVACFILFSASCGGKSPTAPTSDSTQTVVTPNPAPGTNVLSAPVPDSPQPLLVWILKLDPGKSGKLAVGQRAYVSWTCGGPAGYSAFIKQEFLYKGQKPVGPANAGGSSMAIGAKCEAIASSTWIDVTKDTPTVTGIRWYFWYKKGHWTGYPEGQPYATVTEDLNWRHP